MNADLRLLPKLHNYIDPLPNPCNSLFQALPTIVLDGSNGYRMGDLFHIVSEYWSLP